jgi:hypothetical protein
VSSGSGTQRKSGNRSGLPNDGVLRPAPTRRRLGQGSCRRLQPVEDIGVDCVPHLLGRRQHLAVGVEERGGRRGTSAVVPTKTPTTMCGSRPRYAYWSDRIAKGENPTARQVSEACNTTIHAARAAARRYKSGIIPTQMTRGLAPKTVRNIHAMTTGHSSSRRLEIHH